MTPEEELVETLGSFAYDPYGFVMWAFPWGEAGTELAEFDGPNYFQTWVLRAIGRGLLTPEQAIQIAATSGHGVGKSGLVGMITWWSFSTRAKTKGVITANTENQLKTKTWVEINKWYRLFIAKSLFKCTATAIFSIDETLAREWRIDIVPWSEKNTEAFAGLHNQGNRILVIFDEASAIPEPIWEVTEGVLTDKNTEIIWLVFGNPTRSEGRFRQCFPGGKFTHRWLHIEVDSRDIPFTNKEQIQRWIDDYGLDSDFVRVRVLGKFPRVDASSFISREVAVAACNRVVEPQDFAPRILGVDVARYGTDLSVICFRQGRDCSSTPPLFFSGISVSTFAHHVAAAFNTYDADAIMVDGTGVGGGVVDILSDLGFPVYDIQFGARAPGFSQERYGNWRGEMWGLLREALPTLSIIDRPPRYDGSLVDELCGPQYTVNASGAIMLEPKEAMLRRGVKSPDYADALALTFAYPIAQRSFTSAQDKTSYNPYAQERMYENAKN